MIADTTEALLGILKYALLALLYLFFARVLWAVWSEVKATNTPQVAPNQRRGSGPAQPQQQPNQQAQPGYQPMLAPVGASAVMDPTVFSDPTAAAPFPSPAAAYPVGPTKRIPRGRRGNVARLVITQPKASKGATYATTDELSIGRAPGNAIVLHDDTFASQLHARVFRRSGTIWIEDLGSTNGTYVNGGRVSVAVQIAIGDRLQVGNTILEAQ